MVFSSWKVKPSVLLTARTGQVGSELEKHLAPIVQLTSFDRKQFDLEQPELLRGIIRYLRPDIIINAAAYTAVDRAEAEPAKANAINRDAVRVLAEEAERIGALLVHYSTDYVFDGAKASPYVESDPPNPLNVYGASKLAGEQAIRDSGCFHLILRTSWVYAATGKNFVRAIATLAQQKPELRIVNDQHGAPTPARELAGATLQLLKQAPPQLRELYHMTAAGETTWFGLAQEIVKELERRQLKAARLKQVTTQEYGAAAKRPLNSILSNQKLKNDFGILLPDWREGLRVTLKELQAEHL